MKVATCQPDQSRIRGALYATAVDRREAIFWDDVDRLEDRLQQRRLNGLSVDESAESEDFCPEKKGTVLEIV
jgi:hypothetical protein